MKNSVKKMEQEISEIQNSIELFDVEFSEDVVNKEN